METLGFIGLGVMGLPMSKRVIESGYKIFVHDLDPKPVKVLEELGAHRAESPKEVGSRADLVISILPTPVITREVVLGARGAIHGLRPGSLYIDMSTSKPTVTVEVFQALKERGIEMLDAPVSGGMEGAKAGTLTIMVGGDKKTFERAKPILTCMGKRVIHVGKIGSGNAIKLINNILFVITMAATSEALALGKKAGIDPVLLREVLNSSSARSYALEVKVRDFVFPRNFEPGFTVDLQNKDIDLALEFAKELGVPMLLGALVKQIYQALHLKGLGKKDTSIVVTFFEELMDSGEIQGNRDDLSGISL